MRTPGLRGISALFVYYFSTLQFNQKGSSLTDPQKFALTPGFQKRGSIDLQKNEAQETLLMYLFIILLVVLNYVL